MNHRYQPLGESSLPLPSSTTRPLVDSPYESDEEEELKRRQHNPIDHPPVDINPRRPSHRQSAQPPIGVAASSVVVLLAGIVLVLFGMGVISMSYGIVLRSSVGLIGMFCIVSGGYTLWNWVYNSVIAHDGGYLFPTFSK